MTWHSKYPFLKLLLIALSLNLGLGLTVAVVWGFSAVQAEALVESSAEQTALPAREMEPSWVTTEEITQPYMVRDINAITSSSPSELTAVGRTLFFQADDGIHGLELWKSAGATHSVHDSGISFTVQQCIQRSLGTFLSYQGNIVDLPRQSPPFHISLTAPLDGNRVPG